MKIGDVARFVPWVLQGIKAVPDLVRVFRGKRPKLDPALGESEATRVLREAEEQRRANRRP